MGSKTTKVAEYTGALEHAEQPSEELLTDLLKGLGAVEGYGDRHGVFAELVREHYGSGDGSV